MKKSGNSSNSSNGSVRKSASVPARVSPQEQYAVAGESPFVVEEVDYSQFGKYSDPSSLPYEAAPVQQKKTQKRSSTSSSSRSSSGSRKSSSKRNKKKKNSTGIKVATAILGTVAAGVIIVFVLISTGVIKKRYEVTMADGTVLKYTAEQLFNEMNTEVFADGISIDGIDMSGKTKDEARVLIEQKQSDNVVTPDIKLNVDGKELPIDMGNLDLTYNTEEIINEAYAVARVTNPEDAEGLVAIFNQRQQMKITPVAFQTAFTAATPEIDGLVKEILSPLQAEPADAKILGFNKDSSSFDIQPEVNGCTVNIDKASADVKDMLDASIYSGVVNVETKITAPTVTTEFINQNYGKISSSSSETSDNKNRNHNISTACSKIDGYVLNPGDSFSFNTVVGERTVKNGFKEATVILGGQYEQGLGGGICQVSSMLYGAVVKANLKIDNRAAHAWPSTYCDVGTDATVDYGNIDFIFTNNTDYQVILRAYFNPKNSVVTCEVYGHYLENNMTIKFVGEQTSRTSAKGVEYVENPELAVGKTNVVRNAHDGITARSYQIWYDSNGNQVSKNEVARTTYRAYAKKVEVGTKMPDGSHAKLDTKTGEVVTPTPAPTEPTPPPTEKPTEPTPPPTEKPTEKPTEAPEDNGGEE